MTLKISGLSKTYPNGAGKSSLMRTIATLQDPDAGSIDPYNKLIDRIADDNMIDIQQTSR